MAARLAAAVVAVVAVPMLAACGASGAHETDAWRAMRQPAWVTQTADWVRDRFIGRPRPVSVTYRVTGDTAWVKVSFGETAICGGCSHPSGADAPRGRHVKVTMGTRSHDVLTFELTRGEK